MEARKLYSDMELYSDNVLYFSTKEYIFYNIETSGHQNEHARISVIQKLVSGGDYIVVTSLDAILQYTCDKEEFKSLCIDFELGKTFNLEKLTEDLVVMGYSREDSVEGAGQFAIRGGILDIFPVGNENPYRIEFFDDEIERISEIDALTGQIKNVLEHVAIFPNSHYVVPPEKMERAIKDIEKELEEQVAYFKSEDKLIEAQRIAERTNFDMEMLRETGFCLSLIHI